MFSQEVAVLNTEGLVFLGYWPGDGGPSYASAGGGRVRPSRGQQLHVVFLSQESLREFW